MLPYFVLVCVLLLKCNEYSWAEEDVNRFIDAWDYRLPPHNVSLLNSSGSVHKLPPPAKVHHIQVLVKKKKKPKTSKKRGDSVNVLVDCKWCNIGIDILLDEIKSGSSYDTIGEKVVAMCVDFNINTKEVCKGIFQVFGPTVIEVAKTAKINAKQACSMLLGENCKGVIRNPLHEWKIELPDVKKPKLKGKPIPKDGIPTFKVLHLSDTHLDPDYLEGSVSNCLEPLCCRNESSEGFPDPIPAGKFGAYAKCDTPRALLEDMLKHINEQHKDIDFILWTGDLPPHDIWKQTKFSNLDIIKETTEQMIANFPGIPIFPAVGNHESIPAGTFSPPWVAKENSTAWLFETLSAQWRQWLPEYSNTTISQGGFYSVLLRPNLRLISMNSNYCYMFNWWLLVNSTDPAKELQWLIYELQNAEDKGEKVLLIGHIPPGGYDCFKVWSENFYEIVARYEDTITAQFYGHSHADEFELFYDPNNPKRATNVAYIGPSVTTFENYNPAYRIYYIGDDQSESTGVVIDHETWIIDLLKANEAGRTKWYKLYSARKDFDMETLYPVDWDNLLNKMIEVPDAFQEFYKYYYRDSPTRPACNNTCKLNILCDLRSGRSHMRHTICRDLEERFGDDK